MSYWSPGAKRFNPFAAELLALFLFRIYLKMELLTPFAASNDINMCLSIKSNISQIQLFDELRIYHKQFYDSRGILIGL